MRVAIIGGGAAGMMAALTAAEEAERDVVLLERQSRVGRKLLVTGNGRCNLSNIHAGVSHYHGSEPDFVSYALQAFDVAATLEFFRGISLLTVTEPSGRVYPYSDQANSVVDALRFALQRKNITLRTGCEVRAVSRTGGGFTIKTDDEILQADRLIVAAGGLAGTKLGGSLSGYTLLRALGHHCTPLRPSLVQLKTGDPYVARLKGVRANARVKLTKEQTLLAVSEGEVQFTEYGLSGPAVFEISRAASTAPDGCEITLDLLPGMGGDELLSLLCIRISQQPELTCGDLLTGLVHNRLGRVVVQSVDIPLTLPISQLKWDKLSAVAEALHAFSLPLTGTMGMDSAQVTAGGICTREFYSTTLESRIVPGLYAAGEVLDIDGDCGGYNLQWAWSSGRLAGQLRSEHAENP